MQRDLLGDLSSDNSWDVVYEIPTRIEVLPDGREATVTGDIDRLSDINTKQGDNPYGYEGTCGLVSCKNILNQFGVDVKEADVVEHAIANGECYTGGWFSDNSPSKLSGTSEVNQAQILGDYGVPAHPEYNVGMEEMADLVEAGHGVISAVNAGVLWDCPDAYESGQANHAVTIIGTARDEGTGGVLGLFINDSAPPASGRFVDAETFLLAFEHPGGRCIVTDASYQ